MIFYFYGENSFAIQQQLSALSEQYQKKTGGSLEIERFDMSSDPLSKLLNSLGVIPMFASSRLLIVRDFGLLKLEKAKLEQMLGMVSESTILVLIDSNPDKRSAVYKVLSSLKNAKKFDNLSQPQLVGWIRKLVANEGATIDNRTISVLIEKVGFDQWQLQNEIQKLVNYNPTLTIDSIDKLVVPNVEYSVFVMTDALAKQQVGKAVDTYRSLVAQNEPDQKILGAIMYQYRVLTLCKIHEGDTSGWAKQFGLAPYAVSKSQSIARTLTLDKIKAAYKAIIDADMTIKTGQSSSNAALEELLITLGKM
ncbi:MAG: DNA polymerase III subunit delta [Candidatus Saccharibacteria bacterium]